MRKYIRMRVQVETKQKYNKPTYIKFCVSPLWFLGTLAFSFPLFFSQSFGCMSAHSKTRTVFYSYSSLPFECVFKGVFISRRFKLKLFSISLFLRCSSVCSKRPSHLSGQTQTDFSFFLCRIQIFLPAVLLFPFPALCSLHRS